MKQHSSLSNVNHNTNNIRPNYINIKYLKKKLQNCTLYILFSFWLGFCL